METAVKPYPSCRYGHANVDAALALRAELGLKTEEIESVTMGLPNKGMLLVGAPTQYKQNPQNIVDGSSPAPSWWPARWRAGISAGTATPGCRMPTCAA